MKQETLTLINSLKDSAESWLPDFEADGNIKYIIKAKERLHVCNLILESLNQ